MHDMTVAWERTSPVAISDESPTVLVVDDDSAIRTSLERLIRSKGWKAKTFGSAQDFLAWSPAGGPSCLILDVSLPDLDGLELQQRIAVDRVDMPIIFITGHGDVPMSVKAMKAGAMEFLIKPFCDDTLLHAIARAIDRSKALLGTAAKTRELRERYDGLSNRERDVMDLIVVGQMNKQVGGHLGISEITVKAHRGRVMRKMRARSFAALVEMAAQIRQERS